MAFAVAIVGVDVFRIVAVTAGGFDGDGFPAVFHTDAHGIQQRKNRMDIINGDRSGRRNRRGGGRRRRRFGAGLGQRHHFKQERRA